MGADGIHSRTRALVFGPESDYLRYLGFHTAAYAFTDPDLHARLAGRFVLTDSLHRQLGLYGIRDERVVVFAVHRSREQAMPHDPRAVLRRAYSGLGWLAAAALERCPAPPELYYDQVAQVELPGWSRGRVTLVGDACQAVSLLAGQGASLAVAGAHVLASELTARDDLSSAPDRYQARSLPLIRHKQAIGRRTAGWFLPSTHTRLLLRRLALRAPSLGRLVAAHLIGSDRAEPTSA